MWLPGRSLLEGLLDPVATLVRLIRILASTSCFGASCLGATGTASDLNGNGATEGLWVRALDQTHGAHSTERTGAGRSCRNCDVDILERVSVHALTPGRRGWILQNLG